LRWRLELQPSSPSTVLVLDAAGGVGRWAHDALVNAGFACIVSETPHEALRNLDALRTGLVVMPVAQLSAWTPVLSHIAERKAGLPVLGMVDKEAGVDVSPALKLGVGDLLTYPCPAEDLVERVTASIDSRQPESEKLDHGSPIATLRAVTEAAEQALFRAETAEARVSRTEEREHLRMARESLSHSLQVLLGTMVGTTESGAAGRPGHSRTVATLVKKMAQELGWAPERVRGMELAGLLHDIGLLALPADLLSEGGPLSDHQRRLLHTHADASAEILEPLSRVGVPVSAVRAHHERLDGSGYPRGLRGRQIPIGAELLAVADVYAALVHPRPHRPAFAKAEALGIIEREVEQGKLSAKALAILHRVLERPGGGARPPAPPALDQDAAALARHAD
jgi:HD-GYP domain-containing protein (c-di-GMP phosphodiesterase class II)